MSQVIDHEYKWFQEVAPRDFYSENDLERTLMHNLELLFPDFKVFAFKQSLYNPLTKSNNTPDLGMVKSDYSEWYVIEVELGKHTLKEVIEQIGTFRNCSYTKTNSDYIYTENVGRFDQIKLEALILSKQPELMVIVNEDKIDWKGPLKKLKCKTCIFQIYNDFSGRRLFRLDGEHPFVATDFSNCRYEKKVAYVVKVLKPGFLDGYGVSNGSSINIEYNGIINKWRRQDGGKEVFLICDSKIPPLDSLSYRYRLNYNFKRVVSTTHLSSSIRNKKHHRHKKNKNARLVVPAEATNIFTFTKD